MTYKSVDGLEASLHGLVYRFSRDNAWCFQLDSGTLVSNHGALSVDGVAEGVDNSSKHAITDGHIDDRSGSLDDIAFLDLSARQGKIRTEQSWLLTYRHRR